MCQNNVVNIPNMKVCENLSGGSHVVPFRHVIMIRVIVTVCGTNMLSGSWVVLLTQYRQRPLDQVHSTELSLEI